MYSCEIKILIYRRNVGRFILSTAVLSGKTEIDTDLKVFLEKKHYKSLLTNQEIRFKSLISFEDNVGGKDIKDVG